MTKIIPSIGRIILVRSADYNPPPKQPFAAIVTHIQSKPEDEKQFINAAVFGPDGSYNGMVMLPVIQQGETPPAEGYYAHWMDYQIAQQAKADVNVENQQAAGEEKPA